MSFQNTGRYVHTDPDLDTFAEKQVGMLRELRAWGASEMRSSLQATEAPPADPREAFTRLGRHYHACLDNALLKLSGEWDFEEKYKSIAMEFINAGFYDTMDKEGNRCAILEACNSYSKVTEY